MTPANESTIWLIVALIALGTYLIRSSFIQFIGAEKVPRTISRLFRFIPPAALSALIMPAVLANQGGLELNLGNARIIGLAVAALTAVIWKNSVLTIAAGLLALWGYEALLGCIS